MERAQEEAKSMGHLDPGSLHLLLGLASLGDGVHSMIMESFGLSEMRIRSFLSECALEEEEVEIAYGFLFRLSAARALRSAEKGAKAVGHSLIGTEHMLMALLSSKQNELLELFGRCGVEVDAARRDLIRECGWKMLSTI